MARYESVQRLLPHTRNLNGKVKARTMSKSKMRTLRFIIWLFEKSRKELDSLMRCQEIQIRNPGLKLNFPIVLNYDVPDAIQIASNVTIGAFSDIVASAEPPLNQSEVAGFLAIEDNVWIGTHVNIRAAGGEIRIGRNSMIAQQVSLIASNHLIAAGKLYRDLSWDTSKTGVYIGENVWIGAGCTLLPGCHIGKNSVIGAGSVVTKNVPEDEIWAGVPARKIRSVS